MFVLLDHQIFMIGTYILYVFLYRLVVDFCTHDKSKTKICDRDRWSSKNWTETSNQRIEINNINITIVYSLIIIYCRSMIK